MNSITPGNSKTLIISESFQALLFSLSNESKIAKILCRGLYKQNKLGRKTWFFSQALQFNWITWRETSGLISFWPVNRGDQPLNEDGKWVRKGRQDMRISAWVRTALNPKIVKRLADKDFNEFSTLFKRAEKAEQLKCDILSGEENINDIYGESNFANGSQTGSCMFGEKVGEFYEQMGADIAVCRDGNNKLVGRAILWPEIEFFITGIGAKKARLLDRIYSEGPEYTSFIQQWADGQGFVRKTHQNKDDKDFFIFGGAGFFQSGVRLKASNLIHDVSFHPYLDTFTRLSENSFGVLYFYNDEETDGEGWLYNDTDGNREKLNPHEGQVEDIDGNWIDEDDAIEVDGNYYDQNDERICQCYRTEKFYLLSEMKVVHLSSSKTIYIHEDYVEDCE